jgi:hypothetical protein
MPIPYLNKTKNKVNGSYLQERVGNSRSSKWLVQLVKKGKSRNFDAFLKKNRPPKTKLKKRLRRICPYHKKY